MNYGHSHSDSVNSNNNKHLYHNLYSSPKKKDENEFQFYNSHTIEIGSPVQTIHRLPTSQPNNLASIGSAPPRSPSVAQSKSSAQPNLYASKNDKKDNNTKHNHSHSQCGSHHELLANNGHNVSPGRVLGNKSNISKNTIQPDANRSLISNSNSNSNSNLSPIRQNRTKKQKVCKVCNKPIIGTLVRAMNNIYHVDCFTCHDCNKPCSDKFFAADIEIRDDATNQKKMLNVPLCEYDYFKRIDLICHTCDNAIRGSYITALGHNYHPEHFFCEICHQVFESDNYYSSNGKIYCHFHYSKLHAFHCESCKCAILKQYVEIFRGGKPQQWHPECFMVHKFWNVDITVNCLGLNINSINEISSNPDKLYKVEYSLEKLTMSIWLTLSEFEESCASLISEMLHNATTNNKTKGILVTSSLIYKINCLFKSIDSLFTLANSKRIVLDYKLPKYANFSKLFKEPRSLTSKIMSYLTFLRDINSEKLSDNKYSHELLSLISIIAHFIKLISRNALMHALEFNILLNSTKPTEYFLKEILNHKNQTNDFSASRSISLKSSDECSSCKKSIEESCILFSSHDFEKRWHIQCFKCSKCSNDQQIPLSDLSECAYNIKTNQILCPSCSSSDVNSLNGFQLISRFMQLMYLLEIAVVRSKTVINKREKENKRNIVNNGITTNRLQNNNKLLNQNSRKDIYENKVNEITRRRSLRESRQINSANREIRKSVILEAPIASSADTENIPDEKKIDDIPGSLNKQMSINSNKSKASSMHTDSFRSGVKGSKKLKVKEIFKDKSNSTITNGKRNNHENNNQDIHFGLISPESKFNVVLTSKLLQNEASLTLDDIPRIVSSEQAREHRPNAFRFQRRDYSSAISSLPVPKAVSSATEHINSEIFPVDGSNNRKASTSSQRKITNNEIPFTSKINSDDPKKEDISISSKRYSEFSNTTNEYIRHIAAFALCELFPNQMSIEECSLLIDVRKPVSFWEKIFGSSSSSGHSNKENSNDKSDFKSGSATVSATGKGAFGIPLVTLVNKYGVDSDLGVGSQKVRIPLLVDEIINVMRTQDVSAEGVFRLNGNIRRLKSLVEEIDAHPERAPKLNNETPIQLAALLKKFLRDLPIPLLTYKLYDLFLLSQRYGTDSNNKEDAIKSAEKRERILKLAYAMLPKAHRDLTEVLFGFLAWVSTFANVDDKTNIGGSKMDTHNLATVITPNILYSKVDFDSARGNEGFNSNTGNGSDIMGLLNSVGGENQFLAIEVVNDMIEMNEELSIIPEDLLNLYKLAGFEQNEGSKEKDKMMTKDIMSKLKTIVESNPNVLTNF